jgi:hypothetical protein
MMLKGVAATYGLQDELLGWRFRNAAHKNRTHVQAGAIIQLLTAPAAPGDR